MRVLVVEPEAEAEIAAALEWYEELQPGLAGAGSIVVEDVAGAGASLGGDVVGVEELAVAEGEAAAADAAVEAVAEALEHGDARVEHRPPAA